MYTRRYSLWYPFLLSINFLAIISNIIAYYFVGDNLNLCIIPLNVFAIIFIILKNKVFLKSRREAKD